MDKGFMVVLLTAPSVSCSGVAVALTLVRCEPYRQEKRQPLVRKAIGWPETVLNEYGLEAVGRMRDTSIRVHPGHVSRYANLPECWHSVRQAG